MSQPLGGCVHFGLVHVSKVVYNIYLYIYSCCSCNVALFCIHGYVNSRVTHAHSF